MRSLIVPLFLLFACNGGPPPEPPIPGQLELDGEVLVKVNGSPVTQKLVDIGLRPVPQAQREALLNDPKRMRDVVDRLAFAELLYQRALKEELHLDPEVQDSVALAQREILANVMLERIGKAAVTDEAIQERYDAMAVQFKRPSAQVQHILIKKQDKAEEVAKKIREGEVDFLAAAKEHSVDRSARQNGGDLGWTVRPPARELKEAWETAQIGEVVGPIEGRLGFHLIKVTDRRDATPLEEVRDQLAEAIKVDAMKSARAEIMNEADVEYVAAAFADPPAPDAPTPDAPSGAEDAE